LADLTVGELYGVSAAAWARGAELVYGPLAHALVAMSPVALDGQLVVDVGAGTGAGSRALQAVGARVVAVDLSPGMLAHERRARPPAVAADVLALPLRDGALDAALAPFVVNHLEDPRAGFAELARATRAGGVVLASTFSEQQRSAMKDIVDGVAFRHGCEPPPAYLWMRAQADRLGSGDAMRAVASEVGLTDVEVFAGPVDIGVTDLPDLVRYRFGMPHLAAFLASLPEAEQAAMVAEAVGALEASGADLSLSPAVVFLAGRVGRSRIA
jgi:SAM-dependent methyltransferase